MYNVIDQWGMIVKSFDDLYDAERYIAQNEKLHIELAE